ncbi:MAG: hypothetical protein U9Q85_02905 [Patescibacteria group bacterium]|nr:hypothetical protein [Patescibacteria group bacterium]
MIYFSKYADQKFEILNRHQVFFTREQIEDTIANPDDTKKKGKYFSAIKNNINVIYSSENKIIKVITFFPVK